MPSASMALSEKAPATTEDDSVVPSVAAASDAADTSSASRPASTRASMS